MAVKESDRIVPRKCKYCGGDTLRVFSKLSEGQLECKNSKCPSRHPHGFEAQWCDSDYGLTWDGYKWI